MHDVRKIETGQKLIAALLLEAVNSEKKGVVTSLQWGGIWPGIMSHSKEQIDLFSKTGAEFRTGEIFIELDIRQTTGMSFTEKAFHKLFGVTIRHYENTDFESLHHLLSKEFGVGWTHEVLNKVNKDFECFNGYGLASPYNPNDVFVVSNKNEIFGFCIVQSGTGTKQGFFGPVGLVQNMRGKGIGSLLFIEAVNYLKSKGKEQIGLWTNETIYSSFYKKIGCYKTFETLHAEWSV
ncbi:MAG: GNAT family N-acetyltransferase [Desulfobacteraceae bacterium]|nr:GNAT family N-acetyltransferase [Desulfobacteraceae bacterium]